VIRPPSGTYAHQGAPPEHGRGAGNGKALSATEEANHAFADAAEDPQRVVIEKKKLPACGSQPTSKPPPNSFVQTPLSPYGDWLSRSVLSSRFFSTSGPISATGARLDHRLDLIVARIAIGSATNPLHDLITTLSAAKKKNEAAPAGA
jgi:hypothetical protein